MLVIKRHFEAPKQVRKKMYNLENQCYVSRNFLREINQELKSTFQIL